MFTFITIVLFTQNVVHSTAISGNGGSAKIDVQSFGYPLNPEVCGGFNDCFNCTLSHCYWNPSGGGECSNARMHSDDIAIDDFMQNDRTDMGTRRNQCGDPYFHCHSRYGDIGTSTYYVTMGANLTHHQPAIGYFCLESYTNRDD